MTRKRFNFEKLGKSGKTFGVDSQATQSSLVQKAQRFGKSVTEKQLSNGTYPQSTAVLQSLSNSTLQSSVETVKFSGSIGINLWVESYPIHVNETVCLYPWELIELRCHDTPCFRKKKNLGLELS